MVYVCGCVLVLSFISAVWVWFMFRLSAIRNQQLQRRDA
jgi:hypothetical protein